MQPSTNKPKAERHNLAAGVAAALSGSPRLPEATKRKAERHNLAAERAAALLAGNGLLRLPEVLAVFPISASSWWLGVREGRYPQSIKLGARCTCWRAADVRALIANAGGGQ